MKTQEGERPVLQPIEVAVASELQGVGVDRVFRQPARQVPHVEAGLDLLDPGRLPPEDAVHTPVDLEPVPSPCKGPAHRHLRLVAGVPLGAPALHALVYLLAVGRRGAVARMALDAPGARYRQGEIPQRQGYQGEGFGFNGWFHGLGSVSLLQVERWVLGQGVNQSVLSPFGARFVKSLMGNYPF